MHGQVELESCRVAGRGLGVQARDQINSTRALGGILRGAPLLRSPFLPLRRSGRWRWVSQRGLLGGTRGCGRRF